MLQAALVVLIGSLVSAILGFGGIVSAAVVAAELLFVAFIVLFALSVVIDRKRM